MSVAFVSGGAQDTFFLMLTKTGTAMVIPVVVALMALKLEAACTFLRLISEVPSRRMQLQGERSKDFHSWSEMCGRGMLWHR